MGHPERSLLRTFSACVILALACASQVALADFINPSFEDTDATFAPNGQGYMSLPNGSTAIPGWTVVSNEITWVSNTNTIVPHIATPYADKFLDLTGTHDDNIFGAIR